MKGRRRLHTHEVFYMKDRLLAGLATRERLDLVQQPQVLQEGLQTLWPLLLEISLLEIRWSQPAVETSAVPCAQLALPLDEPQQPHCLMSGRQLAQLQDYRDQLLAWSEIYLSAGQWQRIQDSIRQRRRETPPVWLKTLEQALQFRSQELEQNAARARKRFASRLLVPKRSSASVSTETPSTQSTASRPH